MLFVAADLVGTKDHALRSATAHVTESALTAKKHANALRLVSNEKGSGLCIDSCFGQVQEGIVDVDVRPSPSRRRDM